MNLKSLLMPAITAWWLSPQRLERQRRSAERRRVQRGEPHAVHYFHQADDPYSALMVQCLPQLLQRYDVALVPHVVSPPADEAAPDRERLIAYSRKDAAWLAQRHGLQFVDRGQQPDAPALDRVSAQWVHAIDALPVDAHSHLRETLVTLGALTQSLWNPNATAPAPALPEASAAQVQAHLAASDALRQRLGHYNGGMLYYAGEWYWGLDRLHHLEERLQALGAARPGTTGLMFAPEAATSWPAAQPGTCVDFFFSFRSPYSAIAAQRLVALTQGTGIEIRWRFVLPMVMRGLAVPKNKRLYISSDAAREARRLHVPFGRLCDPVGKPTERGLALMPLAQARGVTAAYVLSFMQGVWAEGLDAGSDQGLRQITTRAGLAWPEVCAALQGESWRATAEANRVAMLNLGLWGVPSFRVGDTAVWGQDRLEAVAMALPTHACPSPSDPAQQRNTAP